MSQPQPEFSDPGFAAKRTGRAHGSAREPQTPETRELARERDEAREQLNQAKAQLEQSRQQFVEISALLRQRDAAVQSAERTAEQLRIVEGKLERLSRERNDAQRQRDDALRQRDEAKRGGPPSTRGAGGEPSQLADIQRQIVSIRQARDSAQAQNHELAIQLAGLEDELAELGDARDGALKEAEAARAAGEEMRAQLGAVEDERDTATRYARELESALAMAPSAPAASDDLAAAQRELLSLSEERDALHERMHELEADLERRSPQSGESADVGQVRRELAEAIAELEMQAIREQELLAHADAQEEQLTTLRKSRDEALTSLAAAQKQIGHIMRERDEIRQRGTNHTIELEAQLTALRAQLAAAAPRGEETDRRLEALQRERDEALPKLAQFEAQRLQMIDLAAQLDASRRDVLKLSADVAEARLQVKFTQAVKSGLRPLPDRPRSEPVAPKPFTIEISADSPPPAAVSNLPAATAEGAQERDETAEAPLTAPAGTSPEETAGRHALATMKHCFQTFTKSAGDLRLLRELHAQVEAFADGARISGYVALHRFSSALASFVLELHKYPELLNQASFRTVNGTIDFLGVLLKQKDYAALKDPATALVYVVDDELDNCEAIRMGMETVMLRTQSFQDPAVALTKLPHERCDLIFLDVSMPQMSGFELCQRLRQTPMHARTPIVFLTGMTTIENRVQSSLSGGNDMIGKPFNLAELSLKALTLILRSSLNME